MLFHVSTSDNLNWLFPRVPTFTMPGEDETTPRVCLGQSINGCFRGLADTYCSGRFFIYQINEEKVKCHLHWPTVEEVPDVEKTGEVWSLVPTPVTKIGYVDVIEYFTGEKHYETHIYS